MSLADDYIGSERILEVSSRCHTRFEANRFVIEARDDDRKAAVPAGDVLAVVLESEQATITVAALAACGELGIPIVCCRRHLPVSLSLPIGAGWNGAQVHRSQVLALRSEASARRLWRRTVQAKILSQAALLGQVGSGHMRRVRRMADDVPLEGPETTEAQAAAIYWRALFPEFRRSDGEDPRNGALNWGYAVLLATVGRALVAHGFDPSLGIGHTSRTNPWALASDLMEPYRPTVDAVVSTLARSRNDVDMRAVKTAILRPFANHGPAKRAIMETVHGYREFLAEERDHLVPYPDGPLLA
jgi:CRISPR-associated protein Cas1